MHKKTRSKKRKNNSDIKKSSQHNEKLNVKNLSDMFMSGILHEKLWKRSMLKKIIYISIPFLLIMGFDLMLFFHDVFTLDEGHGFLEDYSNCYTLSYVFIFMYFVHGLFLPFFENKVSNLCKQLEFPQEEFNNLLKKIKAIIGLIAIAVSFIEVPFITLPHKSHFLSWSSDLKFVELLYYALLIYFSWYMSARLFICISSLAVITYKYLDNTKNKNIFNFDFFNVDKKCGLKGLFNALSASMGFGIYFIIAIGMILYSDYKVFEKYHFMLLAYKYNWVIIVITVILCVIYYSIFIITYISLGNSMNNAVYNKLKHSENLSEKQIEFLKAIPTSSVHINDICVFALSVLFPGIAAIVQIVLPLG